jgi:hypothetical protein
MPLGKWIEAGLGRPGFGNFGVLDEQSASLEELACLLLRHEVVSGDEL